ncbi:MAG: ABC transporter, partial [Acetobacteraceae bacterium]|nr:ABC transporter [Acetobacteraceae bacterium]
MTPSTPGTRAPVAPLRMLVPRLRPYAAPAAAAALALLLAAGLVLALGQGLRHLVDEGFAQGAPGRLDRAALLMFGVVAALAAATSARFYLVSWLGERVAADLRRDVFGHVVGLSPA